MSDIIRDKVLLNYSTLTFSSFASYRQLSCPLFSFYISISYSMINLPQFILLKAIVQSAVSTKEKYHYLRDHMLF